jgi:hypothetical protein
LLAVHELTDASSPSGGPDGARGTDAHRTEVEP